MKRLSEQTLYEILEVPPAASRSEIESAYERARAIYEPGSLATYSLMSPDEAALLAGRIEEAKRTLLDEDARASYDAALSAPANGAPANGAPANGAPANGAPANGAGAADPPAADAPVVAPADAAVAAAPAAPAAAPAVTISARPRPFGPLPPVIPALKPANPDPAPPPAPEPPAAQPVILLAAAMQAGGPVAPVSRPILLERQIVPAPTAAPADVSTSTPPPEILNPEGSVWTGEALRRVREARGISIPQIAERTKVTRHHVENIEGERYGALPAPVYLRGILFSLARELRLDGQRVARSYLDRAAAAAANGSGVRPR